MKLLLVFFICLTSHLFSQEKQFPKVIDFSTLNPKEIPGYEKFDIQVMNQFHPFNDAPELAPFFFYLKNTYGIKAAIETGTWIGNTTAFLGYLFDTVYTLEINRQYYETAKDRLKNNKNIHLCLGDSPVLLRQILPSLKEQRVLFYLDAHWYANWPLLNELKEISKTHRNNCIIVVDDFKVPGRSDIGYDSYGGHECSYEYISSQLNQIFTEYSFHYIIPKSVSSRAKCLAIPKKWRSTQ